MSESMARRQSISAPRDIPWGTSVGGPQPLHSSSAGAMGRRMSRRQSLAGSHKTDVSVMKPHTAFGGWTPENTYRLGPSPGDEFNREEVEKVLKELLNAFLDGEKYTYENCSQMSLNLTDVIRRRLKEMNFPRFRFVCQVIIGEDKHQGLECASRCIWDGQMDNYANVCYRKGNLFAVATVFAVYFE